MTESPLRTTLPLLLEAYRSDVYTDGIKPGKLADEINKIDPDARMTQTKIWRMINPSGSAEPKRSSVEPIAKFFGLSYDQVYDIDYVKRLTASAVLSGSPIKAIASAKSPDEIIEGLAASGRKALLVRLMQLEIEEGSANSDR